MCIASELFIESSALVPDQDGKVEPKETGVLVFDVCGPEASPSNCNAMTPFETLVWHRVSHLRLAQHESQHNTQVEATHLGGAIWQSVAF